MRDDQPVKLQTGEKAANTAELLVSSERNLPPALLPLNVGWSTQLAFKVEQVWIKTKDAAIDSFEEERQYGIVFNLAPVAIAAGTALYFAAPREPLMLATLLAAALFTAFAVKMSSRGAAFLLAAGLAGVFIGMTAAGFSAYRNGTVVLERQITTTLEGVVLEVDQNARGSPRMLIGPTRIVGLNTDQMPKTVRVSAARGAEEIGPGHSVSGLARLQPISGPAHPGSYDFSFHAWFEGLGGSGFFMGSPQIEGRATGETWNQTVRIFINKLRHAIADRIHSSLPGKTGGIATALIIGDRSGIDQESQDILRRTGLAHILAISGLHMALVTLTIIWLLRSGFALVPGLALHRPIKKWAVAAGFVGATAYLLLSGGGIATQRAWIMISVMLLAVLMDRRAITMRSVAFSAVLILLISPESLLSPGFQMSFAAVVALVSGYEYLTGRRKMKGGGTSFGTSAGIISRGISGTATYVGGLALTSLIAGTATAFIAAWHFNQVAPLGLLANVLAMPIVALLIMPLVLFSMVLMPFGFEALTLVPVSHGIEMVLFVAGEVDKISPSGVVGHLPSWTLAIFAVCLVILSVFKTRLRLFSLIGFVAMPLFWQAPSVPDILVSENGRAIGIVTENGLKLPYPRSNQFITGIWSKAWTKNEISPLDLEEGMCDRDRCKIALSNGEILHIVYDPTFISSSCLTSDILIAPRLWWTRCYERQPSLVLNRQDFERYGSHAIYLSNQVLSAGKPDSIVHNKTVKTGFDDATRPWSRNLEPLDAYLERRRNLKASREQTQENR